MSHERPDSVIEADPRGDLQALVTRAKEGDKKAFEELYTSLYTPVYRYLLSRTRSREDAEDLAGDSFIKFFNALPRFVPMRDSALPYLFTIARNLIIDRARAGSRVGHMDEELFFSIPDVGANPAELSELGNDIASLNKALAELPEGERSAVTLRYFDGLSMREVAEILEKKEEAVRQLVSRGLRRLRSILIDNHGNS